ncbi:MAG: hypothetical protein WDM91_19640 [Rhizomicrobium sp.]
MAEAGATPYFRRFVHPDPAALAAEIVQRRAALAQARAGGAGVALIEAIGWLGASLVMAGEEAEAAPLLEEALALSRQVGDQATEIDGLLALGTAAQYLGDRARAQALFAQGLALCRQSGIARQEHFLLQHSGRCYVEQGEIAKARAAFEAALAIRKALGEPRFIAATQGALDEIAGMEGHRA